MRILGAPSVQSCAPYGYLLLTVYLFMAVIENPNLFVCGCRTWICLDITRFYEEQRQPSSGFAWLACPKNGESGPHCWEWEVSSQVAEQFVTAVTASPFVVCVFGAFLPFLHFLPSSCIFMGNLFYDVPYDLRYISRGN